MMTLINVLLISDMGLLLVVLSERNLAMISSVHEDFVVSFYSNFIFIKLVLEACYLIP